MARSGEVEVSSGMTRGGGLCRLIDGRLGDLIARLGALADGDAEEVSDARVASGDGGAGEVPDARVASGDGGAEAVHDARVASRRLRAALGLYPLRPRAAWRAAAGEVRALGHALGALRDLDLRLRLVEDALPGAADDERPGALAAGARLRAGRAAARAALAVAVTRFLGAGAAAVRGGLADLDAGRGRLGGRAVRRRLRRRLRRARRLVGPALGGGADHVHALRIALKKLRYHAELLADVAPGAAGIVAALPALQEGLGAVHDADAGLRWLVDELARAPRPDEAGLCLLLRRCLAARQGAWPAARAALLAAPRLDGA